MHKTNISIRLQLNKILVKLRRDGAAVRAEVYFYECYRGPKNSPGSNPFATYVKDILSRSTKNTVTELMINRVCQLTLSSHNNILNQ